MDWYVKSSSRTRMFDIPASDFTPDRARRAPKVQGATWRAARITGILGT